MLGSACVVADIVSDEILARRRALPFDILASCSHVAQEILGTPPPGLRGHTANLIGPATRRSLPSSLLARLRSARRLGQTGMG